jgi:pyruvate,orthophosphate dikinase
MFLGDRLPVVQRMILADTPDEEEAALAELLEVQRADFEEVLAAMDGLPVTVRLLDPPLHEFLPDIEELIAADAKGELDAAARDLFAAARSWQEQNPMLGTRGVRLGILKAGLYKMQVRALMEAAVNRAEGGGTPIVEIMIPLIVTKAELELVRRWTEEEVADVLGRTKKQIDVLIGTMIETPRRPPGRRHRRGGRLLLLRHQRPDPDGVRLLPRRRRGPADGALPRGGAAAPQPVRDDRPPRRR